MTQTVIHCFLHFGMPLVIAYMFFRDDYKRQNKTTSVLAFYSLNSFES